MAARPRRPRSGPRPDPARRVPPVRRGGRAALVAPARRARGPHPDLRRLPLAPVRRLPLRRGDRRRRRPRRARPLPRRARCCGPARKTTTACPAVADEPATLYEHCARRARARPAARRPRPAADGHRRLERRHEPGRRRGRGGERLGRLVPARRPRRVRPRGRRRGATPIARPGAAARRGRSPPASRPTPGTATGIAAPTSTTARPLGSAGNDECRIDSIAQSWAVISGAGRPRPRRPRHGGRSTSSSSARDDGLILLFDPPFDAGDARTRLHQGVSPRHPRERRPVHPRGRLGRPGRPPGSAGAAAPSSCSVCSTRSATPTTPKASRATGSSPTSSRPTSTAARRTSAGAAGPGTPARPPGSTASASKRSSGSSGSGRPRWPSTRASRGDWPGFEMTYRHRSATYRITVENPDGVERGVRLGHCRRLAAGRAVSPSPTTAAFMRCRAVMGPP